MFQPRINLFAVFVSLSVVGGCTQPPASKASAPSPVYAGDNLPPQIINQFGMIFRRVDVDPQRPDHRDQRR